tara:strand:- start:2346 stop:3173 length:828 start_codon:yes stop_codon:yes gene_type:complete
MSKEKIGIAIITCDRPEFLSKCVESIDRAHGDEFIIINDGTVEVDIENIKVIKTGGKIGVGKSKNIALKYLYDRDCDFIFIIEDDTIITDQRVFKEYIKTSKKTGIQHFNYGPGSPFNRKQNVDFDLHNRHQLDQNSDPHPRKIIDYGDDIKISLYQHVAAMFSFFTRQVIEDVGYVDEEYYNAWEHVDHTYRIIKAGLHPPFWYFADIHNSHLFLTEVPGAIENSSINKDSKEWLECVNVGRSVYLKKHGHYPNQPPVATLQETLNFLRSVKPI